MTPRASLLAASWIVGTLAGATGALLFLTGLSGGRMAGFFLGLSPLPLFLAGLGWGFAAVAVAAGLGITAAALCAVFLLGMGGVGPGVVFAGFSAAAPLLVTRLTMAGSPALAQDGAPSPGRILLALMLLGAALVAVLAGATVAAGGFSHVVENGLHRAGTDLGLIQRQLAISGLHFDRAELIVLLMHVLPPVSAGAWLTISVLNGLLAEEILARSGRSLRLPPYYSRTDLPKATSLVLLAAIALCFAPGGWSYLGGAFLGLLVVAYFFLGLAAIHAMSRALPARPIALGVLYLCLALFVWPALILAALGLVDQWADLRGRAERREREKHDGSRSS